MYELLGWTSGQILNFERMTALLSKLATGNVELNKIVATLLAVVELFCAACFKTPVSPLGDELNLTGYELVFEDEFNGTELDTDNWFHRGTGKRRCGYNGASQAEVKDGNLVITAEYLENGEYGAGWYAGAVALKENYTRGYFEIKCKCNEGNDFWSAFWLQATGNPYDHYLSNGGIDAVELDIFESCGNDEFYSSFIDTVQSNIHCNGYDDDIENIDSQRLGNFLVGDIHDEYNTYGLLWTEDEYIFYINGVETTRSTFGKGVCTKPEQVIVSLELPSELSEEVASNLNYKTQMTVDYVRIYQLAA